jgi:ubiquinone/menaquinone biosynthesis C-methylase UbiE
MDMQDAKPSGAQQTEALNRQVFNEHAETYEASLAKSTKWVSSDTTYFAEHKVRQIARCLGSTPRTVLDYGCGIGRNIPVLAKQFPSARHYGCDISEESLSMAKASNPEAKFFINNAWPGSVQFDLIVVANVFHHVIPEERGAVIEELKRFLSPSGSIFVFEHNPINPLTRYSVKQCPFDKDAQLVGPRKLSNLFLSRGYRLIRSQYTLFFPQWADRFSPAEAYLGWLPLGAQYFLQLEKLV